MQTSQRPIGYWLKHLDRLIEATFERTLAREDLSRRHWQIMNVLASAALDADGLAGALRPFWGEGAISLDEVTGDLARRGAITRSDDGRYLLTDSGRATHAAVAERVGATRRLLTADLTQEQYQATVRVLSRMAENLGRALPPAGPPPVERGTR